MAGMNKSLSEYEENGGWSSKLFAKNTVTFLTELATAGVNIKIGRTVIHISHGKIKLKAYVHYKGRTEEYATITNMKGNELLTVHYTEFDKLKEFIKDKLCL